MSFGDQLPQIVVPPPGPRSRELSADLRELEAPGVNTIQALPEGTPLQPSILWQEALGSNVRDVDGNLYIDLTAGFGVAAVGHRHPRVVEAVRQQADHLLHALGDVHAHPLRVELARRLVALAPVDDAQVFFAISGAEAVEIALKTALGATGRPGRPGIIAFEPSYHGMTLGALAVTSRPEFRDPFAAHLHPHVRRLPFGIDLARLDEVLAGGEVGAVIVEPIVGREGVLIPPAGWLPGLADLCRRHGALFIADEIFTGFGRTGRLFAVDHEGVRPDILCCGKALGGGLPIAAVLARRDLFRCWETSGEARHTATFIANPLACAAALAVLEILQEDDLPARAARLGEDLGRRLATWPERFPSIEEVRGRGLLWGIQLRSAAAAKTWMMNAWSRGVLLLAGGPEGRVAQIVPPLTIKEELLEGAVGILEESLSSS
ncbi:MAG: LysW-gamma-L-lysine/LysW-L-ornithine aminotransferase [Acidobacteriota bacterium]|nr:LysW-gamma-L-lysine/LysW-L-ornithine aminotransferase [Acidobacteriota bacterium]